MGRGLLAGREVTQVTVEATRYRFGLEKMSTKTDAVAKNGSDVTPMAAMWLSLLVFPGVGQCANRQIGKGVCMALVFIAVSLVMLYNLYLGFKQLFAVVGGGAAPPGVDQAFFLPDGLLHGLLWCVAVIVAAGVSAADAYTVASRRKDAAELAGSAGSESTGEAE